MAVTLLVFPRPLYLVVKTGCGRGSLFLVVCLGVDEGLMKEFIMAHVANLPVVEADPPSLTEQAANATHNAPDFGDMLARAHGQMVSFAFDVTLFTFFGVMPSHPKK